MRKSLLTLGLASLALTSFGHTRILYQQDFESVNTVEESGWSFGGESISLASDAFGKYIELSLGQNNGRSGMVTWGQDIFLDADGVSVLEDGTYSVQFDFSIPKGSANQYNSDITVFTNHTPKENQPYRTPWDPAGYWQNYLFDMSQVDAESYGYAINGGTIETVGDDGTITYSIDYADSKTIAEAEWYTVTLNVDVNKRTVVYSVMSLGGDDLQSGTMEVPEVDINGDAISMYAEGIYAMLARYQSIFDFDNIRVYFESDQPWANPPVVALTRVGQTEDEELNLNIRAYNIDFLDGETLHIEGTDGKTIEVDFADCEGHYVYETTTSGVMKAWTTNETAVSAVITTEIDCAPIALPGVEAVISSVAEGYAKTYTLQVNNKVVPLSPTIFINYEFEGKDGTVLSANGEATGVKVTVPCEGTFRLTSEAFGYKSTTVTVTNDIEFATRYQWDFARMTDEQVKEAGFPDWAITNSANTSGFDNWTARKRLFYYVAGSEHENEEGDIVLDTWYPFGYVSADSETQILKHTEISRDEIETTAKGEYFEGLTIFPERGKKETGLPNVGIIKNIGLYNNETKNNNNNVYIHDLQATDFVLVNYINNYGGNSCHPTCATDEEYYAQLEGESAVFSVADSGVFNGESKMYDLAYSLYRIDTAITKIVVFKNTAVPDAVESIKAAAGDGFYYSIDGIRVAEPTRPGLYIHNGKKVIVK